MTGVRAQIRGVRLGDCSRGHLQIDSISLRPLRTSSTTARRDRFASIWAAVPTSVFVALALRSAQRSSAVTRLATRTPPRQASEPRQRDVVPPDATPPSPRCACKGLRPDHLDATGIREGPLRSAGRTGIFGLPTGWSPLLRTVWLSARLKKEVAGAVDHRLVGHDIVQRPGRHFANAGAGCVIVLAYVSSGSSFNSVTPSLYLPLKSVRKPAATTSNLIFAVSPACRPRYNRAAGSHKRPPSLAHIGAVISTATRSQISAAGWLPEEFE